MRERLADIKGPKDVAAGAIYFVVGIVFVIMARQYEIGTATNMGPGYFPSLLGFVLIGLGLAAMIKGMRAKVHDPISSHRLEPLLLILASIVSFGFLVERAGLVIATLVCLFFACFRRALAHPIEFLVMFAVLAVFDYVVFVYTFQVQIPMFWWSD
jgi:hypothetical protein